MKSDLIAKINYSLSSNITLELLEKRLSFSAIQFLIEQSVSSLGHCVALTCDCNAVCGNLCDGNSSCGTVTCDCNVQCDGNLN